MAIINTLGTPEKKTQISLLKKTLFILKTKTPSILKKANLMPKISKRIMERKRKRTWNGSR